MKSFTPGPGTPGCLQEIFANLLVISLASLLDMEASLRLQVDRQKAAPGFKAIVHVIRRHLVGILGTKTLSKDEAEDLFETMIEESCQIIHRKRPDRSYPRVSRQPIKIWNLCKNRKLAEFYEGQAA